MINRRRSGARGTPAKVNATAGLEASEGVNSASVSDGSHESVYLCPFYVTPPISPGATDWFPGVTVERGVGTAAIVNPCEAHGTIPSQGIVVSDNNDSRS